MLSLEVCANSCTSALAAQEGGAARVELCENLAAGGTTPSYGQILMARKLLQIKLYVLIRPRLGDFHYSDVEFQVMQADVKYCIDAGCDGIVTGMLNKDGTVDKARCGELVSLAKEGNLGVTFHRAFDVCANRFEAMETIIDMGCERILTSGGRSTAIEGASNIAQLIKKADNRIIIMPGSGINENNVADIIHFTNAYEVHSSARCMIDSQMTYKNDHILMGATFGDDYTIEVTSAEKVRNILKAGGS